MAPSRKQAIRAYYLWLHNGSAHSVKLCTMYGHPVWPYRRGRLCVETPKNGEREPDEVTGVDYRFDTPLFRARAIKQTCLLCQGTAARVARCQHRDCPLWIFRRGSPKRCGLSAPLATNDGQVGVTYHPDGEIAQTPAKIAVFGGTSK